MVKLSTLSLFILLLFPFITFGQINFGIKAGSIYSTYEEKNQKIFFTNSSVPLPDFQYLIGYQVGVLSEYPLNNKLSLKGEFLYASKGTKITIGSTYKTYLNYLLLPIHFQYEPLSKLKLQFGIESGYLLFATSTHENILLEPEGKFDFGLSIGISYLVFNRLGINFRYAYDLSNLIETTQTDLLGNPTGTGWYRSRMLALSIEYFLKKQE